jgi:hypothetical protein
MHMKVIKTNLLTAEEVLKLEKEELNIDLLSLP